MIDDEQTQPVCTVNVFANVFIFAWFDDKLANNKCHYENDKCTVSTDLLTCPGI